MYQFDYINQNDLISSNGFQNTNVNLISQENIFFYENTKFLWKELMKINTKSILRTKDISLLEQYVENILYSKLNNYDVDILSNEYIVQLVTLLQLTGQYLVYVQKRLEIENEELREKANEAEESERTIEKLQIIIDNLNREIQNKDFMIKAYNMIERNGNNSNNININLKTKKTGEINTEKKSYYCEKCGKKFKTKQFLDSHIERKHPTYDSESEYKEIRENNIKEKKFKEAFDKRINSMKEHFENLLRQENNNELKALDKKLELIEKKIIYQNNNRNINIYQNGFCKKCGDNINSNQIKNIPFSTRLKEISKEEIKEEINLKEKKLIDEEKEKLQNYNNSGNNKVNIDKKTNKNEKLVVKKSEEGVNIRNINKDINSQVFNSPYPNEHNINQNINPKINQQNIIPNQNEQNISQQNINPNQNEQNINHQNINQNQNEHNINPNQNEQNNKLIIENKNNLKQSNKDEYTPNDSNLYNKLTNQPNEKQNVFYNNNDNKTNEKKFVNAPTNTGDEYMNKMNIKQGENDYNPFKKEDVKENNINIKIDTVNMNNSNLDVQQNNLKTKRDINEKIISPRFSKIGKDELNKNVPKNLNDLDKKINDFKIQVENRDKEVFLQKDKDYKIIELEKEISVDNEEINKKIKDFLKNEGLENIENTKIFDESEVNKFINDCNEKINKNKYKPKDKGAEIYKLLEIDKIIKDYEEYMKEKDKKIKESKNDEIQKNNQNSQDKRIILASINSNNSKCQDKINIDDSKNYYSSNRPSNINKSNSLSKNNEPLKKDNDDKKKIVENSSNIVEENSKKEEQKKGIMQSIILGHDLKNSVYN